MKHWGTSTKPEKNSGIPVEMPAGSCRPASIQEMIAKYVHEHVTMNADDESQKPETWQEADDFEEEDPDTLDLSKYEFANLQDNLDPTYDPFYTPEVEQEAPQEENVTKEGPKPSSQEETPSGASE